MTPVQLADFVVQYGQEEAARQLGATQAAISKAISSGRHILIQRKPDGTLEAFELKCFPSGGSQAKSRADLGAIMTVVRMFAQSPAGAVHSSSIRQPSLT